ncbi:hypothetical protein [Dyadobacter arcticus]|uniref:Uncharacterized protein n=1 Tax=Dyadobacter arcticus TaxID=1078754 RepID=A0ABX0UWC1_9BACT|nr:hypothetical protein [Dyadobacter arcticus]NIJ55221.1 hypothetical protein [Dyadobacter arcticus]
MKCESCRINDVEVEELADEGENPYYLCDPCYERLLNKALRPLEFFNLAAIHGHGYYLHDDFYDYETGNATQPHIEVIDAGNYPFPDLEQIKNDLNRLIDLSFVQYITDDIIIERLSNFEKTEVMKIVAEKVLYNRAINYKAYEIVGKVVGLEAAGWIKSEWISRRENELSIFAEALAKCLLFEEAFAIITTELENGDDKFLSENVSALIYFKNERTLDWIEKVSHRITNVSSFWGQLAASSEFNWERATQWLRNGRPLSLIALDGLIFCTSAGNRQNQSLWLRALDPRLEGGPSSEVIANTLQEYLNVDSVPRTKNAVSA